MFARAAAGVVLLATLVLSGSLGAPFQRDEVPFEALRRDHFDALAVSHKEGAPSKAPLVVRVQLLGDGADADLSQAKAWLRDNANVRLVADPDGVPFYLTRLDLSATSGRSTLGATIDAGMAAEVGNPRIGPCVVAHEVLHFLGLKHVADDDNIMYAKCTRDKLPEAELSLDQKAKLDRLRAITATTPRGVLTWASR